MAGITGAVSGVNIYVDPETMKQNIIEFETSIESLVAEVKKIDSYIQQLAESRALVGTAVNEFVNNYDTNRIEVNKLISSIATQDSNIITFVNNLIDHDEEAKTAAAGVGAQ